MKTIPDIPSLLSIRPGNASRVGKFMLPGNVLLLVILVLSGTQYTRATSSYVFAREMDENEGYVIINEKLGNYLPSSLVFTGTDGEEVSLLDMIDRPTIISPVYYNCPGLCTPVMDGIVKLIQRTAPELGEDYQVINISFNESETPELAEGKKNNYLGLLEQTQRYGSTSAASAWHFMTGDLENIDLLLESLGFSIVRKGQDIFHPAGIMLVSREGQIVKYIHGIKYNPVEFEMAVLNANNEETSPTIAKIMKACFNYEPAGRDKQLNITIIGFTVMLSLALILFVAFPPLRNKA